MLECLWATCANEFSWAQFDNRIKNKGLLTNSTVTYWVKKSMWSRLYAEWRLYRRCGQADIVLCFHGLPPLLPLRGHVVVFVQNRILFETGRLDGYSLLTRIRIIIERVWTRAMRRNCNRYIVQTPSMAIAVHKCLGNATVVSVLPFVPSVVSFLPEKMPSSVCKYDFVYVASGEAHKNHSNLLEAWRLLADAGLKPSLAVTVNPQLHSFLYGEIARYSQEYGLDIVNLGQVAMADISGIYQSSSALIFPSKTESFGLPLIEAIQHGLPVIAPELDYVRDVVQPTETFDPNSPVSIARAVRRFLDKAEPTVQIHSAEEFLAEVLR